MDCFRAIVRTEGYQNLFRGVLSPVLTTSMINAIVFTSHAWYIRVRHAAAAPRPLTAASPRPLPALACGC